MPEAGLILVFIEQQNGQIAAVSLQLVGKALNLARDQNMQVGAVVLAPETNPVIGQLQGLGLDRIIACEHQIFARYSTYPFTNTANRILEREKPVIFLLGATTTGRDLAARVAARLATGLSADCVDLRLDPQGKLLQIKPTYGGSVMAEIVCQDQLPQMATVRPNVFLLPGKVSDKQTETIRFESDAGLLKDPIRILEQRSEPGKCASCIADAAVIVCGGRGLGSEADFELIEKLATALGGISAGTRPLADAGWIPEERQIGLSGQTVRPDLLIAVGISGAANFTVGLQEAKKIIAINKDPQAPIFKIADVGIAGDAKAVLNQLLKYLTT